MIKPFCNDLPPSVETVDLGPALNHLLNRNSDLEASVGKPNLGGLELPCPGQRNANMGVVVITGQPGSGKSTLALQMVVGAAKEGFDSLYLSLEDHPDVVGRKASSFGRQSEADKHSWEDYVYGPQEPPSVKEGSEGDALLRVSSMVELARQKVAETVKKNRVATGSPPGAVISASLLPRPLDDSPKRAREFFLEQYRYLDRLVKASADHTLLEKKSGNRKGIRVVVIDSLNMLSYPRQSRESLYRFFDLFRATGIMGIFVVDASPEQIPFDSTMADVVFNFSAKADSSYLIKYLSLEKSRYTATSFGLHPYKIAAQHGIQVLPSLHALVAATSKAKVHSGKEETARRGASKESGKANPPGDDKSTFPFGWGDDLTKYVVRSTLKRPGVVALHGPNGTRKSTIAVNFLIHGLIGYDPKKETAAVVARHEFESGILIRLTDPGEYTNFASVQTHDAMNLEQQQRLDVCPETDPTVACLTKLVPETKASVRVWGVNGKTDGAILVVIDFHTGMLLPEEFVDIIRSVRTIVQLSDNKARRVGRVALDDISVIGGGSYPLLRKSETTADLFLAAFIHLMRNWKVNLMLIGTRGPLLAGNEIVDRALGLATAVVETKIKDIFGDRYVLLSGDGTMATDAAQFHESVPPVLRLIPTGLKDNESGPSHRMLFDRELLRGLTGFDEDTVVARTKVYAYLYEENLQIHRDYNRTLPYLLEPLCGLPSQRDSSGLQVISFTPAISDTIHRNLRSSSSASQSAPPPKAHTVLAMVDEFGRLTSEVERREKTWDYVNNVLFVAWRTKLFPNLRSTHARSKSPWLSWQQMQTKLDTCYRSPGGTSKPTVWVDRVARETLSCCLLDCLLSSLMLTKRNRATIITKLRREEQSRSESGERNFPVSVWDSIWSFLTKTEANGHFALELHAMHRLLRRARESQMWNTYVKQAWHFALGCGTSTHEMACQPSDNCVTDCVPAAVDDSIPTEINPSLPPDAAVYICWYSQLRHLFAKNSDATGEFSIAPLPAGGFKGDWHLRVLPGSVSQGLGNEVAKILSSPQENYRRFVMGVGLPVAPFGQEVHGTGWRKRNFRGWPGASENVTLDDVYRIHDGAHRRSSITDYQVITRALSTFATRFAGDWDNGIEMSASTVASHLRRLPDLLKALIDQKEAHDSLLAPQRRNRIG